VTRASSDRKRGTKPVAEADTVHLSAKARGGGSDRAWRVMALGGGLDSAWRVMTLAAAMSALYGIMTLAMFPPWRAWWLAPLAVAPLMFTARALAAPSVRDRTWLRVFALAVTFVCALGFWLWLERWVDDVSDAGWPALGALMATWPTLFVLIVARLLRRGIVGGRHASLVALVAALVWTGIEAFRAHIFFDGYPWYLLAHPLIDAPWLAQSAEIWSVAPLSFLCAWSGAAVAEFLWRRLEKRAPAPEWRAPACIAAIWALLGAGGAIRMAMLPVTPGPIVAVVQTNVPSSNKVAWTKQQQLVDFTSARDDTVRAIRDARGRGVEPVVVIWPETMLPGFGLEPDSISLQKSLGAFPGDLFSSAVAELVEMSGVPMLLGSNAFEGLRDDGERWRWHRRFNSVYLVQGDPPFQRYDKLHLTPFGERMPYFRVSERLQNAVLNIGARGFSFDLDEGTERVVFTLRDGTRAVTPICFEDTLSGLCRDLVDGTEGKRADLIINLSNDGWFGDSVDGRATHELAARWRAIELRVGLVRAANTGLSSIVDPTGRVLERLRAREAGWLVAPTVLSPVRTVFARVGDVGSWLAMIATALVVARSFLRRPVRATAAVALLALVGVVIPSCESTPPPTRTSAAAPPSPLARESSNTQQSWSTRELSVGSDQARVSTDGGPARPVEPAIPVVSSGSLRQTAVDVLHTAARSRSPILKANAIEELTIDPDALRPVIRPALVDPNRGVRFVAAMAIGKARLTDMATLVQPLLMDQSASVRAAAIYSLAKLGQPVDLSPLAEMIRSDDPEVRGNAVMILGDLGNPSAIPMLRSTIGLGMSRVDPARRRITDLQLAEALAKLGEDSELEPIRAALFAPSEQAELIALACQIVARMKDGGSIATLKAVAYAGGTATRPPEIRLLAFVSLADLGAADPTICEDFSQRYLTDRNPQLRGLAVRAMAGCGGASALPQVESRLYDSNPLVQIAAASAILQLAASGQLLTSR